MGNGVNDVAVGIAVGFSFLGLLFTIAIVQCLCKDAFKKCADSCKKCSTSCKKCTASCNDRCKKKEPTLKDKVLKKVGLKKSPPPFSISNIIGSDHHTGTGKGPSVSITLSSNKSKKPTKK